MTQIAGLPLPLQEVPSMAPSPDDPEDAARRAAWRAWADALLVDNNAYQEMLERDEEARRDELILCAADPAYWLARWGWIYEPRPGKRGGSDKPFIPFAVQVDLLRHFEFCMEQDDEKGDAIVSKCRDMGASWIMCAYAAWGWIFKRPWQVRLFSYVQDYVDQGYQKFPDSLFWKIDYLLDHLPGWMLPRGYDPTKPACRTTLNIINPVNGNLISGGSSTGRTGRAGRATWVGYDEFAMFEDGGTSWSSTTNVTDHRFAVSSEHIDYGDHFQRLWKGSDNGVQASNFAMDWWSHPHHDRDWYERERRRFEAIGDLPAFAREVERNAYAGNTTWVYPQANDLKNDPDVVWTPLLGNVEGGIDPGFRDKFAIVWAQEDPVRGKLKILDAYQNKGMPADFYASLIKGEYESGDWSYGAEEERIIEFTSQLDRVKWYGDAYGHNVNGATTDSVYSRLATKGIYVNRDRLTDAEVSPFRRQARTYRGRQEALREVLPRLEFANTPGAVLMLRALQQHRFDKEDTARVSESKTPLHDWTSHLVSALEYLVVNRRMRQQLAMREYAQPTGGAARPKQLARWAHGASSGLGVKRMSQWINTRYPASENGGL